MNLWPSGSLGTAMMKSDTNAHSIFLLLFVDFFSYPLLEWVQQWQDTEKKEMGKKKYNDLLLNNNK